MTTPVVHKYKQQMSNYRNHHHTSTYNSPQYFFTTTANVTSHQPNYNTTDHTSH